MESSALAFVVGILIFVALAIQQWSARKKRAQFMEKVAARTWALEKNNVTRLEEQLSELESRDPGFDRTEFLEFALQAFSRIRNSFSTREFEGIHRYVSDSVLRRLTAKAVVDEFLERRYAGTFQVTSHIIYMVDRDDDLEMLHVHFRLTERGTYVSNELDHETAIRAGRTSSKANTLSEFWSFARRGDATTKAMTRKGVCPNCGAPLELAATLACTHCEAILNSGTHDWVLFKISRDMQPQRTPRKPIEGLSELKHRDRALNRQVLEDKASLVFWKWIESRVMGEPNRFARYCTPEAFEKEKARGTETTRHLTRAAIVSLDLARVDLDSQRERSWFRLRWKYWTEDGGWQLRSNMLLLERKAGQTTNPSRGMATERCHQCAAPQSDRDAIFCDYCDTLLSEDWSFVGLFQPSEFSGSSRIPTASPA